MACFLVPGTEAIVTTIVTAVVKKKENDIKRKVEEGTISVSETKGHDFSRKLGWLNKMLWGGSALLAFEHVWHGEVSPVFPFSVPTHQSFHLLEGHLTNGNYVKKRNKVRRLPTGEHTKTRILRTWA